MTTEPQIIPTADVILRPALDQFYVLRPRAFQHMNYRTGVYWHPFLGFRAQTSRMLNRLADLFAKNRLTTATGDDLKSYVASEYDAVPDVGETFAVGELELVRTASTVAGDVRKGTKFTRAANLTTQIPLPAAQYETLVDVHFDVGQLTAGPVAVRATTSGVGPNHPVRTDVVAHGVSPASGQLFDKTISVSSFSAAGGIDKTDDEYVRQFARAFAIGQYGPTVAAARLGALSSTGVRKFLAFDIPGTGTLKILVADKAWASSTRWVAAVQQSIYDSDLVGYGCKIEVGGIRNKVVSVEATVALRDTNYTVETTDVDLAIAKAVNEYLNDRADWNVWKESALSANIARAHSKIFNCTSVVMKDAAGVVVSEITNPDYTQEQFHFFLSNGAVKVTYTGPS